MNFRQLYTSSTPRERREAIEQLLQTIEARNNRLVFVLSVAEGRLRVGMIRDRRGAFRGAHFLNDKRRRRMTRSERLLLGLSLNLGAWSLLLQHAPQVAAPIVALNLLALSLLFLLTPMPRPQSVSAETA